MKQVAFISRSKLAQNLMGLILPTLPQKVAYHAFDSVAALSKQHFVKAVNLVIFDHNSLSKLGAESDASDGSDSGAPYNWSFLTKPAFKKARKILIHSRNQQPNTDALAPDQTYAKPFLPEELLEIIKQNL